MGILGGIHPQQMRWKINGNSGNQPNCSCDHQSLQLVINQSKQTRNIILVVFVFTIVRQTYILCISGPDASQARTTNIAFRLLCFKHHFNQSLAFIHISMFHINNRQQQSVGSKRSRCLSSTKALHRCLEHTGTQPQSYWV